MSHADEILSEIAECWLVTTRAGRDSQVLAILDSQLTSAEMLIIVDQFYRLRYLTLAEHIRAIHTHEVFVGFSHLNDGTVYDQRIGNDVLTACRAYNVVMCTRRNRTRYLQWRQKGILREWNPDQQTFWTNEWWEDNLTLELDSAEFHS
jgi:hypothetical protein